MPLRNYSHTHTRVLWTGACVWPPLLTRTLRCHVGCLGDRRHLTLIASLRSSIPPSSRLAARTSVPWLAIAAGNHKKLSHRSGTARRNMSVKISSAAAQLYKKYILKRLARALLVACFRTSSSAIVDRPAPRSVSVENKRGSTVVGIMQTDRVSIWRTFSATAYLHSFVHAWCIVALSLTIAQRAALKWAVSAINKLRRRPCGCCVECVHR